MTAMDEGQAAEVDQVEKGTTNEVVEAVELAVEADELVAAASEQVAATDE